MWGASGPGNPKICLGGGALDRLRKPQVDEGGVRIFGKQLCLAKGPGSDKRLSACARDPSGIALGVISLLLRKDLPMRQSSPREIVRQPLTEKCLDEIGGG